MANYEEGWNSQAEGVKIEGLKNIRMWGKVGIYITRLCTEEDFAEIIPGWSSFADIKNIDPYAETTLTSAGLNRIRSVLADGNIMIFEHMKGYQTNPEDVIPYEKGAYKREDSGGGRTMEQIEVRDLEPFLNEEGKFRLAGDEKETGKLSDDRRWDHHRRICQCAGRKGKWEHILSMNWRSILDIKRWRNFQKKRITGRYRI